MNVYIENPEDPQFKSSLWTKNETTRFIEAYELFKDTFIHAKQRKHVWEMIAAHLLDVGVQKSAKDCSLKWNNLIRSYKAAIDNKNKTGRLPVRFEYYEDIDRIVGSKPRYSQNNDFAVGVGVNIGASTSSTAILSIPSTYEAYEPNTKKRKQIRTREEYFEFKIEREKRKEKIQMEFLNVEKEKLEIFKKYVEQMS